MKVLHRDIIGMENLLQFMNNEDDACLEKIKQNITETRFWILFYLFHSNMNSYFQTISARTVKKVFVQAFPESQKRYKNAKYISNYKRDIYYKEMLRLIRNSFAHNQYTLENDLITVISNTTAYCAKFNIDWLECLCLHAFTSLDFDYQNGMINIVSFPFPKSRDKNEDFDTYVKNGNVVFLKFTANRFSRKEIKEKLKLDIPEEEITYNVLASWIKEEIEEIIKKKDVPSSRFPFFVTEVAKKVCASYENVLSVQMVKIDWQEPYLHSQEFTNLHDQAKIQVIQNQLYSKENERKSIMEVKQILDFLDAVEEDQITPEKIYALKLSRLTLLKAYASITFMGEYLDKKTVKINKIIDEYYPTMFANYHFSREYYEERIQILMKAKEDLDLYNGPKKEKGLIDVTIQGYKKDLECLQKGNFNLGIYRHIRNAFAHNTVKLSENFIEIYDYDPELKIPVYEDGKWKEEFISSSSLSFSMHMKIEDFIAMISDYFEYKEESERLDKKNMSRHKVKHRDTKPKRKKKRWR